MIIDARETAPLAADKNMFKNASSDIGIHFVLYFNSRYSIFNICFNQSSTTGVTKAMVCARPVCGMVHIKDLFTANRKE